MTLQIGNITFRRNIDRPAFWVVTVNGMFFAHVRTDAVARALRQSRHA